MATLNQQRIVGVIRGGDREISIFTKSPDGDSSDSLQFLIITDTKEQADALYLFGCQCYDHERTFARHS